MASLLSSVNASPSISFSATFYNKASQHMTFWPLKILYTFNKNFCLFVWLMTISQNCVLISLSNTSINIILITLLFLIRTSNVGAEAERSDFFFFFVI